MEHQLNMVNEESLKIGLKTHERKPKLTTNTNMTDNIQIDAAEIEEVANYEYLG